MIYLLKGLVFSLLVIIFTNKEIKRNYIKTFILNITSYIILSFIFKDVFEFHYIKTTLGIFLSAIFHKLLINGEFTIKSLLEPSIVFTLYLSSTFITNIISSSFIKPENVNDVLLLTTIDSLIVVTLLIIYYRKTLKRHLKDFIKNFEDYLDFGFKFYFIGLILMVVSNLLIALLIPSAVSGNEDAVQKLIKLSPILMLINTSIMAPLEEELIFRLSFLKTFKNSYMYVLVSGLLFGFVHVIFSYKTLIDFVYVIPYSALGLAFAYMTYKKDNIFLPISFHFFHNFTLTLMSLLPALLGVIYG